MSRLRLTDDGEEWPRRVDRSYWRFFIGPPPQPPAPELSFEEKIIEAAGGSLPTLDFRFAERLTLTNQAAAQDMPITFTRASVASYFDADGNMQIAAVDEPRFDHDPITKKPLGLLIEEARTNNLLNSAELETQTLLAFGSAAATLTLSFYGPGIVRLTSTSGFVVTLDATGETAAQRSQVTFKGIPDGDDVTLTVVSGAPKYAQLEAGSFASSWIPTTDGAVTRAKDRVIIDGTTYADYFLTRGLSYPTGTMYTAFSRAFNFAASPSTRRAWTFQRGTTNNSMQIRADVGTLSDLAVVVDGGVTFASATSNPIPQQGTLVRSAVSWDTSSLITSFEGAAAGETALNLPFNIPPDLFSIGSYDAYGVHLCGHIRFMAYWPAPLDGDALQAMSAVS